MGLFWSFSLVKSAKKIAFLQQKKCSNKKNEENKSGLDFNSPLKTKCASLNFEIWVVGANVTDTYLVSIVVKKWDESNLVFMDIDLDLKMVSAACTHFQRRVTCDPVHYNCS